MNLDKNIKDKKAELLSYFRDRAAEFLVQIKIQFAETQADKRARAINEALTQTKNNLLTTLLQKADKEKWTNQEKLESVLMITYCSIIVMVESRNSVRRYEYMDFSRRVGEFWDPFCKLCFYYPINDVSLFVPPLFSEARKYQAFYTKSTPIVDYMVGKLSLLPTDKVLEPCGGDGVFVAAILAEQEFTHVDICELNPESVEILNEKFSHFTNVNIKNCDTLLDEELNFKACFGGFYDKIIANPPYGAWQDYSKRAILKKIYLDFYAKETYGLFLHRCIELLKEDGILSFIIPDTFLNLHLHKALRKHILTKTQVVELALFPSLFFPGVNFGYANLSIITLRKKSDYKECMENTFSVVSGFNKVEQLYDTNDNALKVHILRQEDIFNNADHTFLIAENSDVLSLINKTQLKIVDVADCVTGFYSGDDKRFLQVISADLRNGKNYDIVNPETINQDYNRHQDILDGIDGGQYFIPIVKGGNTKYLKPENWFMNWGKEAIQHYKTDKKARFQNPKYYFRFGIGVPMVSSSSISAALIENKLFDQSIVGVFPKHEELTYYLLAFFNAPTCNKLIRVINPSANNPANYIKKIPFIIPEKSVLDLITKKTKSIIDSIRHTGTYQKQEEEQIFDLIKSVYGA